MKIISLIKHHFHALGLLLLSLLGGIYAFQAPQNAHAVPPTGTASVNVCYDNDTYFWSFSGTGFQQLRLKLDNPANFGAGGTHPTDINLIPITGGITMAGLDAANCHIFASASDLSLNNTEASEIITWAEDCNGYIVNFGWSGTHDKLLPAMGASFEYDAGIDPHTFSAGANPLQNNVFGSLPNPLTMNYNYFRINPLAGATVWSTNNSGEPTIVENANPNILTASNMVAFGYAWGGSSGNAVNNDIDRLAMNMFAHAIDQVQAQCVSQMEITKSVTQIYRNDAPIGPNAVATTGDIIEYEITYETPSSGTVYDVFEPAGQQFIDNATYNSADPDQNTLQDVDADGENENVLEWNVSGTGALPIFLQVVL